MTSISKNAEKLIQAVIKEEINAITQLLQARNETQKELHSYAKYTRDKTIGNTVYFRGLIEFSNICKNDCNYCGIRKSNSKVSRYEMTIEEIMEAATFCNNAGYGSIVLQSGEKSNNNFTQKVTEIIITIKKAFPQLGITLSLGEQNSKTYQQWFDAGAERYLLRIETTNIKLYKKIHPKEMNFEKRKTCLDELNKIGYQVGTGVMIGIPGQTFEDLANDILFFKKQDIDMIGMGPFIPSENTPMNKDAPEWQKEDKIQTALNMIAIVRILMPTINIAATTALQALNPIGREKGLLAGANIIMPIVTPKKYRKEYQLYDGKPCIEESSEECKTCITNRIKSTGMGIGFGKKGNSKHFYEKRGQDD